MLRIAAPDGNAIVEPRRKAGSVHNPGLCPVFPGL
jgi:hypothetical protein